MLLNEHLRRKLLLENSGANKNSVSTSASKVARHDDEKGDVIVMTNSENATEVDIMSRSHTAGTKNLAHVKVARATARVIVTTKAIKTLCQRPILVKKLYHIGGDLGSCSG